MVVEAPVTPPQPPGTHEPVTVVPPRVPTTPEEPRIQPWNREAVMVVEAPVTPPQPPGTNEPVTVVPPHVPTTPEGPRIQPWNREPVTVAPTHPPTAAARDIKLAKLRESAEQIEALMLKDIVARLRQDAFAHKPSDPMAGLAADMMNDAVATALSRHGGIGIGRMLTEALAPAVGAAPTGAEAVVKGPEEGA
jgi:hypothetical protein